jgi:hypothetical protein
MDGAVDGAVLGAVLGGAITIRQSFDSNPVELGRKNSEAAVPKLGAAASRSL